MTALRTQQEDTEKENQQLKEKIKKLEQKEIDHEHDIKSVHLENTKLAALLEKTEKEVEQHKAAAEESGDFRQRHDMLQSRFQILDDESVASDNTIKDLKIQYEQDSCIPARVRQILS